MTQHLKETFKNLIERITEEHGKIDEYLKDQLDVAIKVYSEENQNNAEILTLLQEAHEKLEKLQIIETEVSIVIHANQFGELKTYLKKLRKTIKETKTEELPEVMTKAIKYGFFSEIPDKTDQNQIAKSFLQLFLRVPSTKLHREITTESNNFNNTNAENRNEVLEEIKNEINVQQQSAANLSIRASETTRTDIKEKLLHLRDRLKNVSTDVEESQIKKLDKEIDLILESLVEMDQEVITLQSLASKSSEIASGNEDFARKKSGLISLLKSVKKIKSTNVEVNMEVTKIKNRIRGYILVEGMNYLRHNLEVVEDYKSYAQQFAYPKRIQMYDIKKEELESLLKVIENSFERNSLHEHRINVIRRRILKVLEILEKKANENEETLKKLEELENIEREILNDVEHTMRKLQTMNDYRKKIQDIEDFTFRVVEKKSAVLQQLHKFELKGYNKLFPTIAPAVEECQTKYKILTDQLNILRKSENIISDEEISIGRAAMKELIKDKIAPENTDDLGGIFERFFDLIQQLKLKRDELNVRMQEIDSTNSYLEKLAKSEISANEKNLKELSKKIRKVCTTRADIAKEISHLEGQITVEKAKIKINEIGSSVKQIVNRNATNIHNVIADILNAREAIEDLPKGNPDLDSHKKMLLQELHTSLSNFDQILADFAFKKPKTENVLNVESYFKFKLNNVSDKENVEFVGRIRSHAATFENAIKCYVGSRTSVDYYIIDENLSRCLDELNGLKCDDEVLLDETIQAMTYVKRLKSQLLGNAICSD